MQNTSGLILQQWQIDQTLNLKIYTQYLALTGKPLSDNKEEEKGHIIHGLNCMRSSLSGETRNLCEHRRYNTDKTKVRSLKTKVINLWNGYSLTYIFTYQSLILNFNREHTSIEKQAWDISRHDCILTHWGRVRHICVSNVTIIGSDNGLSPGRRQAIIWTNAGILLIGPLGTNFSEILVEIHTFWLNKMPSKMLSGKWRPFCLGLNVLNDICRFLNFFSVNTFTTFIAISQSYHQICNGNTINIPHS